MMRVDAFNKIFSFRVVNLFEKLTTSMAELRQANEEHRRVIDAIRQEENKIFEEEVIAPKENLGFDASEDHYTGNDEFSSV